MLFNFVCYYSLYGNIYASFLAENKKTIEQKLEELTKLTDWTNLRAFYRLQQQTQKMHKSLHKLCLQYDELLHKASKEVFSKYEEQHYEINNVEQQPTNNQSAPSSFVFPNASVLICSDYSRQYFELEHSSQLNSAKIKKLFKLGKESLLPSFFSFWIAFY